MNLCLAVSRHALWLMALSIACSAQAAPKVWQLDKARSQIRFVIEQMNVPVEGGVGKFNLQARFDPSKPESGQFTLELDMSSIDTGSPDGDGEARRPVWFDLARHPKARFENRTIKKVAEGRYLATGNLTMKGQTKAVQVPFSMVRHAQGDWLVEGQLHISRASFGIGGGDWNDVVADRAEARFRLLLKP